MKKFLLLPLLAIAAIAPAFGQQVVKYAGAAVPDTLYADPRVVHTKVLPPATFLAQLHQQRPAANRCTITVTYEGFTPEAQAAFQYAVDIWQSILISPVPINVTATWTKLGANVLGSAGPSGLYNLSGYGERISNSLYPTALVEKLAGGNINGTTADINASFSSDANWYLGTDGNVPAGQYDLVSVVLHELGHGLGFLTAKEYSTTSKVGSLSRPPSIYADFMTNGAGLHVADTRLFANPSVELGATFVSNDLYFDGPLERAGNGGQRARLYAPIESEYRAGSSVSHLDENTYGPGDPNSLMSPAFASAEAIHNPGPIMLGMFNDMGWFNTAVRHTPYPDTETPTTFPVTATVVSDGTITAGSVKLNYSFNNGNLVTLPMTATSVANRYTATIPNPGTGVRVSYYIEAMDNETQRVYTAPGRDPFATTSNRYSFFVGPDVVAPTLVHTPPSYLFPNNLPFSVVAQAADNIGVASVTLEYNVNGTARPSITMTRTPNTNTYTGVLSTASGAIVAGDVINYRLVARDASSNANQTTLPATGYFAVPIVDVRVAQDSYLNNFERVTPIDFVGDGFSITTPTGFANGAIHSTHPYADNVDYFYRLLVPIRIKADTTLAKMRFNEIVLVEPGETGAAFPTADFYDYVVVEGSLDGTTWSPVTDGYDARANANWLDLYIRASEGDNSAAVGTPSIYATRTINLLKKYNAGDVVQFRFRLHSDAGANGWGWAIDNLIIQDNTVTATAGALQAAGVSVFPNPTAGQFTIQARFDKPVQNLQLVVRNAMGQEVLRQVTASAKGQVALPVDLTQLANGFYLVNLTANGETVSRKVLLNR